MNPLQLFRRRRVFLYPGAEIRDGDHHATAHRVSMEGETSRMVETGRTRLMVAACVFGLVFSIIGGRLVQLMVVKGPDAEPAPVAAAEPLESRMGRADIVDRNGVVLATSLPTVNLFADARNIPERDRVRAAQALPMLFPDMDGLDVLGKLETRRAFIYLRRNLTPAQQKAVNDLGIPGLNFERAERRVYPAGRLVAHVVGATDIDNNGIAGLEQAFDDRLTDSADPLTLSLDLRVQHATHRALSDAIDHFQAVGGAAIVMDVRTAEVLSLVSLPDYEPEAIGEASADARFNRATLGVFEMGSTFKLINTALGLKEGYTLSDGFDASQPIKISRFTINDFHGEGRWLSIPEILMHSSNIGSARLAVAVGTEKQRAFMDSLGLLKPLDFELPEIGHPLVPQKWREINTMTIAFGHGMSVTPLHLTTAVSSLINGGILHSPTLLRRDPNLPLAGTRVLSEENSIRMRALMRLVVESGSGRNADVKGYFVGGKTGTAEKETASGGYSKSAVRSSFIAAFPMTDPRYAVLVMLDDPKAVKGTYGYATAGWNATPTAGRVIAEVAPILGVSPVAGPHPRQFEPALAKAVGLKIVEPEGADLAAR